MVRVCVVICFFCFKQKTAYEMRISDWSSDVCSSDLIARTHAGLPTAEPEAVLDFVGSAPAWARAFLQLHRSYREASETAAALSDRLSQNPDLIEISHAVLTRHRSEERRVGKEGVSTCRSWW